MLHQPASRGQYKHRSYDACQLQTHRVVAKILRSRSNRLRYVWRRTERSRGEAICSSFALNARSVDPPFLLLVAGLGNRPAQRSGSVDAARFGALLAEGRGSSIRSIPGTFAVLWPGAARLLRLSRMPEAELRKKNRPYATVRTPSKGYERAPEMLLHYVRNRT